MTRPISEPPFNAIALEEWLQYLSLISSTIPFQEETSLPSCDIEECFHPALVTFLTCGHNVCFLHEDTTSSICPLCDVIAPDADPNEEEEQSATSSQPLEEDDLYPPLPKEDSLNLHASTITPEELKNQAVSSSDQSGSSYSATAPSIDNSTVEEATTSNVSNDVVSAVGSDNEIHEDTVLSDNNVTAHD